VDVETTTGASMKKELVALSDWVWGRIRSRLEGLTDEELLWEPYPGCWTVRQLRDGTWVSDYVVQPPVAPPLTTIAWRIVHLIGCYGSARNSEWLAVELDMSPLESWAVTPSTAAEAIGALEAAHERWQAVLNGVDDPGLGTLIGPIGGQYAEATRAALVWHQLDEFIHHGAEVALMRDLFRTASVAIHADPVVTRLIKGDLSTFDEVSGRADLVSELAGIGRWDLVEDALERGFPPDGPAPTALHRAAAIGMTPLISQLVAAGADPAIRDPEFRSTPSEWAEYFGHNEIARQLALGTTAPRG
jgi:hypothetical protein